MGFDPQVGQLISIGDVSYHFVGNPSAPDIPYGQEGRAATVYKIESNDEQRALKVFKTRFRLPSLVSLSNRLDTYADLPGLTVCRRSVLTSRNYGQLLRQFPDLSYAVVMPWITGPTWMEILSSRTTLTHEQSHRLAHSFASVLCELEQQGIAHCDLSAANLILPIFAGSNAHKSNPIELVDVEQLFAPNLDQPENVPSGSEGYAHRIVREEKTWNAFTDRFSGAILIAEMLGWCDPSICQLSWGESFFDPKELQKPGKRFERLVACKKRGNANTLNGRCRTG